MERVLGVDPGSRVTGYGVIECEGSHLRFVSCGIIKTNLEYPFAHRLNEIFDGINEVIQLHEPYVSAVEDVFMANNARSALKLGQARGAVVVAAMQNGLQVYDYNPKMVKQAVAGYGQAEKIQVQNMVKTILGLSASPSSDAADALAVAICHANQFRFI